MGILNQSTPQMSSDLVFDSDFEISHNWKNGSVHLLGYQAVTGEIESDLDTSDDEEEDLPVAKENGQLAPPAVKAPAVNPKADNKSKLEEKPESDEDDSSDEDDDDEDDSDDDEEMGASDSDGEEDDSDDSEEETPAKVADVGKKRPNADVKTPQSKKAKLATPQKKTDGKKGPQPTKGSADNKTPKSAGSDVSCGPCKKSFKSEVALQSHTKAKHGGK
ncbi:hypothetical protein RND81_09G104900 [Saponaria officinalis]